MTTRRRLRRFEPKRPLAWWEDGRGSHRRLRPYGESRRDSMRFNRLGPHAKGLGQDAAMKKEPRVRARRAARDEIRAELEARP